MSPCLSSGLFRHRRLLTFLGSFEGEERPKESHDDPFHEIADPDLRSWLAPRARGQPAGAGCRSLYPGSGSTPGWGGQLRRVPSVRLTCMAPTRHPSASPTPPDGGELQGGRDRRDSGTGNARPGKTRANGGRPAGQGRDRRQSGPARRGRRPREPAAARGASSKRTTSSGFPDHRAAKSEMPQSRVRQAEREGNEPSVGTRHYELRSCAASL